MNNKTFSIVKFIQENKDGMRNLESAIRFISYLLPGRYGDHVIPGEFGLVYVFLCNVGFLGDVVEKKKKKKGSKKGGKFLFHPKKKKKKKKIDTVFASSHLMGTAIDRIVDEETTPSLFVGHNETKVVRNLKTLVAIVQHFQLCFELISVRYATPQTRWNVILSIESFKFVETNFFFFFFFLK
ncbi:hypothetical protein RFI_23270 [Reticulomyxa filosa]|uniref:Peroxisomal membrane protein PEX16 n=1 Tax=Reticulomyxa filosa TaxID=46433 RepID=X6MJA7_RETFI|nr:hypothetical protein RFI_23270 [Reticulomyxa filosa]|eukprot:ETO14098.1 hypothetical protein RFI_23270 [Reticulomyxa filosa]